MGHLIQWDNEEKTVVFQQYTDNAIKDDLYYLAEKSATMLQSVPYTVHLIIDERAIKLTLTSADIKFLEKRVPANQGAVVVLVNKNDLSYKKYAHEFANSLAPKAFDEPYFATTPEEARTFLQKHFEVHYP
jgi:hypothetical protein